MKSARVEISPLMNQLSAYITRALGKPLPAAVVERAKVHLVDTFAAMISGSRLVPGKKAIGYVKSLGGKPEAGVIGTRIVTSAPNAAFANGMFGHADETDDTHPPSQTHPGVNIVPAVLAICERERLSGTAMLRAMVLGYDICGRTGLALAPPPFITTGHHTVAFGGVFGATCAAGALLELDARAVRYALSYAAQQAAGLAAVHRDVEHVQKAFNSGMASHNGVASALMASQGFTGVEDIFSGERDFFLTFAGDPERAQRSELVRGLGRDYEIMRSVIKCWPVGGPIQGPAHMLRELILKHGIKAADVEKVVARMPDKELMIVNNRDMPDISVQHLLAVMLLDGTLTFKSTHDFARVKDPRVLALRKRIEAVGDPNLTDPQRRWRCVMEITLKDGRKLGAQTMAAKGSWENPVTPAEEEEKALDLLVPVLGKAQTQALLAALWNVERTKDVRTLRKLYAK